jgi:hypothetical protein
MNPNWDFWLENMNTIGQPWWPYWTTVFFGKFFKKYRSSQSFWTTFSSGKSYVLF